MALTIGDVAPDFTPVCTTELGYAPNYPIIGDSDHAIAKAYGMLPAEVDYLRIVPQP
jgi:alkyl hydroperoxide reductase subunit AhpC